MIPELEKPRVTEIQVRMDCNGCVQKIKKALGGINGIYDINIDFPQQKITIIGWADLEKIVKAIKKTRKIATICVHTEPTDPPARSTEQAPEGGAPAPEEPNPPPAGPPPAEAEPPKDPPPPENPPPEAIPPPVATETRAGQPVDISRPKDVEEIHVTYHHQRDHSYRYGGQWNNYHNGQVFLNEPPPPVYHSGPVLRNESPPPVYHSGPLLRNDSPPPVYRSGPVPRNEPTPSPPVHHSGQVLRNEPPLPVYHNSQVLRNEPPPPVYVTHSYNTYRPSPYVTEYEYIRSPPRQVFYSRMDHYSEDHRNSNNGNGNITSMFSDENPNACRIV